MDEYILKSSKSGPKVTFSNLKDQKLRVNGTLLEILFAIFIRYFRR